MLHESEKMAGQGLNALKFATAAGIWLGVIAALSTICAMLNVPGFKAFTSMIVSVYGPYGYSVTFLGIFIGAFWGFAEGFVHVGIFALLYNWLLKMK